MVQVLSSLVWLVQACRHDGVGLVSFTEVILVDVGCQNWTVLRVIAVQW